MNYPLSYQYKEFPPLDKEEKSLLCHGALDLILIEDASELLRQTLQADGVFEYILKNIVAINPEYEYIRSETFPFYLNYRTKEIFYPTLSPSSKDDKDNYNFLIENYKEEIVERKAKKLVTLVGINLGDAGGHYAAFHYDNSVVSIFDSMQTESKRTTRQGYKSLGYYTGYFIQLAQDIFPRSQVIVPDCIKEQLAAQITGGFSTHQPLAVRYSSLSPINKKVLSIQSTESQNHFCYLWAIWYIHLRVSGINFEKVAHEIFSQLDSLVVIKRYAWCLLELLKLDVGSRFEKFFQKHFLSIWSNVPLSNKLSMNFARYNIPIPKCENMENAISESIIPIKLIQVANTPIPKGLC